MQQATILALILAPGGTRRVPGGSGPFSFRAFSLRRSGGWLLVAALSGVLGGCKAETQDPAVTLIESDAYKTYRPAAVNPLSDSAPPIVNLSDGSPFRVPASHDSLADLHSRSHGGIRMPTADLNGSQRVLDNPLGKAEDSGERTTGWTGVADIYWKLNWARKELLQGNVPRDLQDTVMRARKHSERIAKEGTHQPADLSYHFPAGLTVEEVLAPADSALKHLDEGMTRLKPFNEMEEAGIHPRFVPWSAGEEEVRLYFERQGFLTPDSNAPPASAIHEEDAPYGTPLPPLQAPALSMPNRQQQAITLALNYARRYRASPEDSARKEFESALRDIIRMRDMLKWQYHPASVPGDNVLISASLHQEDTTYSPPTPTTPKPFADPFSQPEHTPLIR